MCVSHKHVHMYQSKHAYIHILKTSNNCNKYLHISVLWFSHVLGLVAELRDVVIKSIALGKAHAVALSEQGHIYTFGINNKGQCGRDYVAGAAKESKWHIVRLQANISIISHHLVNNIYHF